MTWETYCIINTEQTNENIFTYVFRLVAVNAVIWKASTLFVGEDNRSLERNFIYLLLACRSLSISMIEGFVILLELECISISQECYECLVLSYLSLNLLFVKIVLSLLLVLFFGFTRDSVRYFLCIFCYGVLFGFPSFGLFHSNLIHLLLWFLRKKWLLIFWYFPITV